MKLKSKLDWYVYLLYVFLVVALTYPVLFPPVGKIVYGGDLLTQFYYWKGFVVESIRRGEMPFWNPYLFSGTPHLAHPAVAFFYPATLLYFLLPFDTSFSWVYAFHLFIGGVGMYRLVRIYGVDRLSSTVAGAVFLMSGYFGARIYAGHIDLLTTAVWIPWVIGSFYEVWNKPTRKAYLIAVLCLTLEILAGYMAYVVMTMEMLGMLLIFYSLKKNSFKLLVWRFLSVVFLAICITAIQWLPTWQLTRNSIRGDGLPYDVASWGSLPLSGVKLFFEPLNRTELNKIVFNLGGGSLPNPFDHYSGYMTTCCIGILIVLNILYSIFTHKSGKEKMYSGVYVWVFLMILAVFISLGSSVSFSGHAILYKIVPMYKFIRMPIQHLIISVVGLPLVLGLLLGRMNKVWLTVIVGILCVGELYMFNKPYIFLVQSPGVQYDTKLLTYLSTKSDSNRVLPHYRVISPVLSAMDLNVPVRYHIPSTSGYDPVILKNYYHFIDAANHTPGSSIIQYNVEIPPLDLQGVASQYLNVGYVIEQKWTDTLSQFPQQYEHVFSTDLYALYKNKNIVPRYYFTPKNKIYSEEKSILDDIVFRRVDPLGITLIQSSKPNIGIESCDTTKNEATLLSYAQNDIQIRSVASCRSLLASSEVMYPGWHARVDGVETPIYTVNGAFRSLIVPSGTHMVEMYYRPDIYYIGIGISIIGILSTVVIARSRDLSR